jgi:hypothetical protein
VISDFRVMADQRDLGIGQCLRAGPDDAVTPRPRRPVRPGRDRITCQSGPRSSRVVSRNTGSQPLAAAALPAPLVEAASVTDLGAVDDDRGGWHGGDSSSQVTPTSHAVSPGKRPSRRPTLPRSRAVHRRRLGRHDAPDPLLHAIFTLTELRILAASGRAFTTVVGRGRDGQPPNPESAG